MRTESFAAADDLAACRDLLRGGSRSFFAASLVLPRRVRDPATSLYAFCRIADDAIDQGVDRDAALGDLHDRLDRIYRGEPRAHPADRMFADTVFRFEIPQAYPRALLEGFEWDARGRRYASLSQLRAYGVRVAGTVGAMMALVMKVRDPDLLARACDLGVAMQLTNIARDVGEDARAGRLYLPLDWLRGVGLDVEAWLAEPVFDARIAGVVQRLLVAADDLYARADAGIARLPASCRPGMRLARLLYAEIGHELERRGLDSVSVRTVVPWQQKTRLVGEALLGGGGRGAPVDRAALREARFLIDSLRVEEGEAAPDAPRWRSIEDRVVWLLDLFERLERRERALRAGLDA